ncbi:hypothetical protein [Campylobacter iguaniorum]|uniref:hypothetical protein n=1 Tax=Campylobacter iguaniorum TaxID=1244531 RepID=UPI000AF0A010|nr:hypothetical protein [Campylobacter iguaniorum]
MQKQDKDIFEVAFGKNVAYCDDSMLYIKTLPDLKNVFDLKISTDKVTSIAFMDSDLVVGFSSGYALLLHPNKSQETLIDPIKSGFIEQISSINVGKDKLIFTIGRNTVLVHDTISKIQKKTTININSKIIATTLDKNSLYIATFDRNLYMLDVTNFKLSGLSKTGNLITSLAFMDTKPLIGLSDGSVMYGDQKYTISSKAIEAIRVINGEIFVADASGVVRKFDNKFNLKNEIKAGNDTIRDMFIDKNGNLIVMLWNASVYTCKF